MIVLSIDPPNAWALMTETKVIDRGRVPIRKDITAAWVARWAAVINDHPADAIGIEGVHIRIYGDEAPYIKTAKQRSAVVLSRRAGIIEGVCRCYRPACLSRSWRLATGGRPTDSRRAGGRERLKAAAVALVKQLYQLDVSHDEADAILIGRHLAIDIPARERGRR
jgi:hypothetical protein